MSLTDRLRDWFRANARALPWRTEPRDPYASLVAELMAQQTQLERVVPAFTEFMRHFPSLDSLARAEADEVLERWSGLGYYRRARMLHRLAREVSSGTGALPQTAAELEKLPGVGPYTAAAVASIVFGERVPLVDGNVARVGGRFLGLAGDPRARPDRAAILAWVEQLQNELPPGLTNEALMELGALVCTPTRPRCERCPLADDCRAKAEGDPEAYPPPRKLRPPVELRWVCAVVEAADGRWLLHEVTAGPILRGLWLPPYADLADVPSLESQAFSLLPFKVDGSVAVHPSVRHSITHRRIEVIPVAIRGPVPVDPPARWCWANPRSPGLPTSSLLGKLLRSLTP
jgi:A/G-specific adenine glycosylase